MPLVRALVEEGHAVTALTRSPEKEQALRALGAVPAIADALDPAALRRVVQAARPTHVIHELTALPREGVRRAGDLIATNRLRVDGTRHLIEAAIAGGAKRIVVGSFAPFHGLGLSAPEGARTGAAAVASMESQVLEASRSARIEGVVLRYGLFYGPENPAMAKMIAMVRRRLLPVVRDDRSLLPFVHIADAVSATVAALDHGTPGRTYDIVDDRPSSMAEVVRAIARQLGAPPPFTVPAWLPRLVAPFMASMAAIRLPLSNAQARAELGWHPAFSSWQDALADMAARAA
jgi:nucleoside-diphosphate-sugar epimerase